MRAEGVSIESLGELIDKHNADEKAIAVLLEQLGHDYPDHVREAILRALATSNARNHWGELVDIFEHNTKKLSSEIRYVAALALSEAADDTVLDDVIRLIGEKRLGMDRVPLLLPLLRSKSPKAKMMLLELRDDPDLGKEIKKMRRLERHQKAGK